MSTSRDPADLGRVRGTPGDRTRRRPTSVADEARHEIGLDHPRSGEIVALSEPDAWFAYPFWLDDGQAPDYARTVDIHRKPGYDPCELFFDPKIALAEGSDSLDGCSRRSWGSGPSST